MPFSLYFKMLSLKKIVNISYNTYCFAYIRRGCTVHRDAELHIKLHEIGKDEKEKDWSSIVWRLDHRTSGSTVGLTLNHGKSDLRLKPYGEREDLLGMGGIFVIKVEYSHI
ncbi:unnamed protein product [Brassica oleracea var. botrytis]|uniref:Uncharacterized protein n=2 Tax=Brassica TaxID=3705 RepID=A0A3P6FHV3_BRAOL|nr:unnamed protein product [Brassica napus]VDD57553.1 unnamed protein product [Brassica oleracea]